MVTLRGRPSCIRERSGPTRSVGGWWRSATIRRFCNIRWESPITEARTLRLDYEVTTTTGGPQTLSVRPRPRRRPPASRARGHLGGAQEGRVRTLISSRFLGPVRPKGRKARWSSGWQPGSRPITGAPRGAVVPPEVLAARWAQRETCSTFRNHLRRSEEASERPRSDPRFSPTAPHHQSPSTDRRTCTCRRW